MHVLKKWNFSIIYIFLIENNDEENLNKQNKNDLELLFNLECEDELISFENYIYIYNKDINYFEEGKINNLNI